METRTINFAYNEPLIYKGEKVVAYTPPFWGNLDPKYLCWEYSIYNKSKTEIEEEYKVKFPLYLEEDDTTYDELIHNLQDLIFIYMYCGYDFNYDYYANFIEKKQKFIYAINITRGEFFLSNVEDVVLSKDLLDSVKQGLGCIIFFLTKEGHFKEEFQYKWMNEFCLKFGLRKEQVKLFSGNLLTKQQGRLYSQKIGEPLLFDIVHDIYFENFYWFSDTRLKYQSWERTKKYKDFFDELNYVRTTKKRYHFLCFNRRLDYHRLVTYGQLNVHPSLKGKFIATMHNSVNYNNQYVYRIINGTISTYNPDRGPRAYDLTFGNQIAHFLKQIDYTNLDIYDEDPKENLALSLNVEAHRSTFVNIITETLYDPKTVFITEKLFKSIHLCQPFLIVGNPFTLREIKKLGYKTFSRWWNEDYDEEVDSIARFNKLLDVYVELSKLSIDELFKIQQEMEDTLIHNFNVMMDLTRHRENTNILVNLSN